MCVSVCVWLDRARGGLQIDWVWSCLLGRGGGAGDATAAFYGEREGQD